MRRERPSLLTSRKNGSDISHAAFAIRRAESVNLLLASSLRNKIAVTIFPFADYLKTKKSLAGLRGIRIND
jgi:hypothetical protein